MTPLASAGEEGQGPDGIRGPPRRFVTPSLREEILAATAKAVDAEGYERASVESICGLLGISPHRFREDFRSKQAAVLCAVEEFADRVIGDCKVAFEQATSWPEAVWAVSTVFTDWCACEPCFARLWIVEMWHAGEPAQKLMAELLDTFSMFLEPGFEQLAQKGLKKGYLDEKIGERLLTLLHKHITQYSAKTLLSIAPDLTSIVLTPVIGEPETERFIEERLAEEHQ